MSMMYLGPDFAGQGMVRELSRVGCRVLGNYPVVRGETLSIRISLPTHPKPLVIEQATVQWVKELEYGVAFQHVDEREADRLQEMLEEFLDMTVTSLVAVQSIIRPGPDWPGQVR